MAKRNGSLTLVENVFNELRNNILYGKINPGEALMPSELKIKFNVSIAVIREALTRLASQGIVIQSPNRGFKVIDISKNHLENIIEARKINEGTALKLAISNKDIAWESEIIALHHKLEKTPRYIDTPHSILNDEWNELHHDFHLALIKGCKNDVLIEICERLWDISEVYRQWSIQQDSTRPLLLEHRQLLESILNDNIENALNIYNNHIELTALNLLKLHDD